MIAFIFLIKMDEFHIYIYKLLEMMPEIIKDEFTIINNIELLKTKYEKKYEEDYNNVMNILKSYLKPVFEPKARR